MYVKTVVEKEKAGIERKGEIEKVLLDCISGERKNSSSATNGKPKYR